MIVTYHAQRQRFEAKTAYEDHEARRRLKDQGWRWDPWPVAVWHQADPAHVEPFEALCDPEARLHLVGDSFEAAAAELESQLGATDIDLPCPPGLAYRPYQKAGIAYALSRQHVLIADEMGLGKTIQAIGLCNADDAVRRVLVLCPAGLRLNWRAEWRKWSTKRKPVKVVGPNTWPSFARRNLTDGAGCVILSYDSVRKWRLQIDRWEPDVLICDESHYLKTPGTRRTRNILGYQRQGRGDHVPPIRAHRTVFLTGTPLLNRPAELWTTVRRLDPLGLGSDRGEFWRRYINDSRHLDELNRRLRRGIMVRRLKKDVEKDLPPKQRQIVPLMVSGADDILKHERSVLEAQRRRVEELKAAELKAREAGDPEAYRAAVMAMRQGKSIAMTEISKVRHETAMKKLPAAIEHIKEVLDETEKLVIFAHHHDVIDGLAGSLERAVAFDGRTSLAERHNLVSSFQADAEVRCFIGGIAAAGLGITLTAASTVIFVELDWTPARMSQAEDRCHRIGQTAEMVVVQHLVIDDSIDARMSKMLVEKQAVLDQVLGDKPPEDAAGIFDDVLGSAQQGGSHAQESP